MRTLWRQLTNFLHNFWTGLKLVRNLKRRQLPSVFESFSVKEIYVLFAAMLVFVIAGGFLITQALSHHGPGPHYGGDFTEGLAGQPQFINPVLAAASSVDTDLSRIVFAQLLKFNPDGQLVPDLAAEMPTVSADQKTYTLKLQPGLKWQDGQVLNADDVLFTIQTIQNADFQSPLRPNWTRVKVDKVDDLTLTFQLREVAASFMNNFALGIIPRHIWQGLSSNNFRLSNANLKPVGSGPFAVNQIKKTSDGTIKSITLKPNKQYYQGRPYLDQITFKFYDNYSSLLTAYQGHEIQNLGFVPFDPKALAAPSDKYNQYRVSLPQYQAVFFNLAKNQILAQKAVRQALWLSANRSEIIEQVFQGNSAPAFGPILPDNLGYDPSLAQSAHLNIAEASQILDKAGWVFDPNTNTRTKDKKTLEFNLTVSNIPLNVKTAQLLQSQWAEVGAKVNLVVLEENELEQNYIRPRAFDALLFSENTGPDPDPFPFWHSSQSHDPGLNFSGFNNGNADKLLTEGRQTTDLAKRASDYQQFQQIINDQLPAIFLTQSLYIYDVPKKIQGINLNHITQSSDRFADINKWYLE